MATFAHAKINRDHMDLSNLIAVSGVSGIYQLVNTRANGLILEDLASGKRRLYPSRKHQFTPLESIAIYTDDGDAEELKLVFQKMLDLYSSTPPVAPNSTPEQLYAYLAQVLPNYDEDRVYAGDVRKLIKWFTYLHEQGKLTATAADSEEE